MPRGGVSVGFEIARALDAPFDLVLVRKIGVPRQPELALGAATDGDKHEIFIDKELVEALEISDDYVEREKSASWSGGAASIAPAVYLSISAASPAIVVDDGICTGASREVERLIGVTRRTLHAE